MDRAFKRHNYPRELFAVGTAGPRFPDHHRGAAFSSHPSPRIPLDRTQFICGGLSRPQTAGHSRVLGPSIEDTTTREHSQFHHRVHQVLWKNKDGVEA